MAQKSGAYMLYVDRAIGTSRQFRKRLSSVTWTQCSTWQPSTAM